jgi:hypothetical protein
MVAVRRDAVRVDRAHVCHSGCPGRMDANSDDEARDAWTHHQVELEVGLVSMLAGRKSYAAAFRPRWWWLCSEQAAPYRADPSEFEPPSDVAGESDPEMPPWAAATLRRRKGRKLGQLRYLARQGLLERWEELAILVRGGPRAKVLREELDERERRADG